MRPRDRVALSWSRFATAAALLLVAGAAGDAVLVPAEVQVPLFARILAYDRALAAREGVVLVGVLVQDRHPASVDLGREVLAAWAALAKDASALPLRAIEVRLSGGEDLAEVFRQAELQAVYVTPLRALEVEEVAAAAVATSVVTLTAVPDYVSRGVAIGVSLRDNKPEILVNLRASTAQGADLDSRLLGLARVTR